MALLIDSGMPEWMTDDALRDELAPLMPGVDIRLAEAPGDLAQITMLATASLRPGLAARLPNLALVQKLGVGVESMLADPDLPAHVRLARLSSDVQAAEIAEFCLAHVLQAQWHLPFYAAEQRAGRWSPRAPATPAGTTVGVLGLGHVGARVAATFAGLGYRVMGWSRSPKALPGIEARHGAEALAPLLGACDWVVAVLPSTPATRGLADAGFFTAMKPGARLINVGRGDLIDDAALLSALESGRLAGAVLDVTRPEPPPPGHPFWANPRVTLTPHVAGWHLGGGFAAVAENYRRLQASEPLVNEIDRNAGY